VLARFGTTRDPAVAERMQGLPDSPAFVESRITTITKMAETAIAAGTNHWGWTFFPVH